MTRVIWTVFFVFLSSSLLMGDDAIYVKAKNANLRKSPVKTQGSIDVDRGTKMTKTGKDKTWYKVSYNSQTRWVYSGKVTTNKDDVSKGQEVMAGGYNPLKGEELAAGSAVKGLSELTLKFAKGRIEGNPRKFADFHQSYINISKLDLQPVLTENKGKDGTVKFQPVIMKQEDMENFLRQGKLGEFQHVED